MENVFFSLNFSNFFRWRFHAEPSTGPPGRRFPGGRLLLGQHLQPGAVRSPLRRIQRVRNWQGKWFGGRRIFQPAEIDLRRDERRRLWSPLQELNLINQKVIQYVKYQCNAVSMQIRWQFFIQTGCCYYLIYEI